MIRKIALKNFKSHKSSVVQLGNLTVIAGQNGVGKSSLLQALLLLRQSDEKNRLDTVLDLNAPLCFIGKTRDALYQYPEQEVIEIRLMDFEERTYRWSFDASNESTYLPRINPSSDDDGYELLSLFTSNFQYVSAGRSADYETDNYAVEVLKQLSKTEGKGELTAQYLYQYGKELRVDERILHPDEDDPYLHAQTTAWEREISTGVNVYVEPVGDSFEIRFGFQNKVLGETDRFSSKNVGFGLSYALPIIVAILSAAPGALLLIENPEAHLHPSGQAKLAELICLAAQIGVQVIIETHSDHIINGVAVQCRRFENEEIGIDKKNVKIYSFDRNEDEHRSVITEVVISKGGKLANRPETFFDQFGKDVRKLF